MWTFSGRFSKYFSPPSLGRCLTLLAYWTMLLIMLWSNVILTPSSPNYAYKWEIVGFRAAWVSVTQLPFIYCLSCKINVISLITGISYERLNWLHRWAARTLFLTVIVHWSFFFREWSIAKFVRLELEMMPMVKYGFGAWAVIGWMVLSGFGFFRSICYEIWVLQHLAAAAVLLWLVHTHVPAYATYNVWLAVGFVAFDRIGRALYSVTRNVQLFHGGKMTNRKRVRIGHLAEVKSLSTEYIHVSIENIGFSWKPGQHVYLIIPRIGILENHPFTIANVPKSTTTDDGSGCIELYIKVHSGFTRRLHSACQQLSSPRAFRTFISGPWGTPPSINRFESLVFMATGNGASFTIPLFHKAVTQGNRLRRIRFVWIIRYRYHMEWFNQQLLSCLETAQARNIDVSIHIYITRRDNGGHEPGADGDSIHSNNSDTSLQAEVPFEKSEIHQSSGSPVRDLKQSSDSIAKAPSDWQTDQPLMPKSLINIKYGRPSFEALLLPVIEKALGETGILACGGRRFTADLRNYVARTSDERAVHKGTGAQGLYLFCETYGW
jgi:hypothetical protein